MADVLVVHRQLAEDLFLAGLQLCQELLELGFVEDFAGGERPGGVKLSFSSWGNSSEDHFAEVILRPLLDAHRIGNGEHPRGAAISLRQNGPHWNFPSC